MSRELTRIIPELIFPLGPCYSYCPGNGTLLKKIDRLHRDGDDTQSDVSITIEWLTKEHALLFQEEALTFHPSTPQVLSPDQKIEE